MAWTWGDPISEQPGSPGRGWWVGWRDWRTNLIHPFVLGFQVLPYFKPCQQPARWGWCERGIGFFRLDTTQLAGLGCLEWSHRRPVGRGLCRGGTQLSAHSPLPRISVSGLQSWVQLTQKFPADPSLTGGGGRWSKAAEPQAFVLPHHLLILPSGLTDNVPRGQTVQLGLRPALSTSRPQTSTSSA